MDVGWFNLKEWEDVEGYETFERPLGEVDCGEHDFDVISVFASSEVTGEMLEELRPEAVVTRSTGFDHIDTEKAEELGIEVYNVPNYGSSTVAEHAFALLLFLSRNLRKADERTRNNFSFEGLEGFELKDKKLGVVGTGEIGQKAIKIAKGFEMEVIAYDPYEREGLEEELGFMYVELEDLIQKSDIISLHCPLTRENHHMFSSEEFEEMDGTVLINTARGGLVEAEALVDALEEDYVKYAGLDVLEEEDEMREDAKIQDSIIEANEQLIEREDALVTPHSAFNTWEAKQRIVETTIKNIEERPEENRVV
ncbi:MAG: NAD(P)-dependent oxidoreductase [Candidatus Nanohaloarchaea archaeon]